MPGEDKINKVAPPVAQPSASEQLKPSPVSFAPIKGMPMDGAPAPGRPQPGAMSAVDEIKPAPAPIAPAPGMQITVTPTKSQPGSDADAVKPVGHSNAFVDLSKQDSAVDKVADNTANTKTTATAEQPKSSFAEAYEKANKKPTDEELEKERKRARSRAIIAAIGDGISSLSNLFFTTKGAPNMYDANNAQSKRIKDEWDGYVQKWQDKRKEYDAGLLAAQKQDADAAKQAYDRELDERKLKIAADKAEREAKKDDLYGDLMRGRIAGQELKNLESQVKAEYAGAKEQSIINKNNRANTGRGGGGGGRGGNKKYYGSIVGADGNDVAKGTKADYDQFADKRAQEEKVPRYEKRITRTLDANGNVIKTDEKVNRRSSSQIASDVANKTTARRAAEAKAKQQQANAKPKQQTSNGKKSTGGFAWQ